MGKTTTIPPANRLNKKLFKDDVIFYVSFYVNRENSMDNLCWTRKDAQKQPELRNGSKSNWTF